MSGRTPLPSWRGHQSLRFIPTVRVGAAARVPGELANLERFTGWLGWRLKGCLHQRCVEILGQRFEFAARHLENVAIGI